MFLVVSIILLVSLSLVVGALWGTIWGMSHRVEGFMIALAGGALIVAAMDQMIEPALEHASMSLIAMAFAAGAIVFTVADTALERRVGNSSGAGLALAVTLDGVPENIALGTALIDSPPIGVAALAAAILLSNLPESAGSARRMYRAGRTPREIVMLWSVVAGLLFLSGIGGFFLLRDLPEFHLALIHCFAAGAVISSLATEVFPAAYRAASNLTGIAVAIGVIAAEALTRLGPG